MPNELIKWSPPEEKTVRLGTTILGGAAVVIGGAVLIKTFVPTITDAVNLLRDLLSSTTHLAFTGIGLAVVIGVGWDLLVPGGRLNGIVFQAYASLTNWMTWQLMNIDPITPLTEQRKATVKDKQEFEEHFSAFDGVISRIAATEAEYRADAAKAERLAKQAQKDGKSDTFDSKSYEWGSLNTTADEFAKMRIDLEPVREKIKEIMRACDIIVAKLDTDIRTTKDKWAVQQQLDGINRSARKVLSGKDRYELAKSAAQLVNAKYAESFGRLKNLKDMAQPLLDSISLERGSYNQDLLDKWNAAPKLLESSATMPMPLLGSSDAKVPSSSGFKDLIR
ncbi:MAG: hypothetical protein JWL82_605 [Parcubacteria group bacterium]|nr:hypothetical protein [Parcubacteria group bacterium]